VDVGRLTWLTMWRRAVAAYFVWVLAHVVGGAVFAAGTVLFMPNIWWQIIVNGIYAGAVFGVAQWLALRPFLPRVSLWAPVTFAASPVSWTLGVMYATATLALGGWVGAGFSAAAQAVVLALSFRPDQFLVPLSLIWIPVSVIGGAFFYFFYLSALIDLSSPQPGYPSPFLLIFVGSVAYGVVTGLVVDVLVVLSGRRAAHNLSLTTGAR
jgi:hypothetical protein